MLRFKVFGERAQGLPLKSQLFMLQHLKRLVEGSTQKRRRRQGRRRRKRRGGGGGRGRGECLTVMI